MTGYSPPSWAVRGGAYLVLAVLSGCYGVLAELKVAIVTGAGNGLGRAYAEYLGKLGAKVLVNDPSRLAADQVVATLGGGNSAVANYDSVEHGDKIVDAAVSKCTKLFVGVLAACRPSFRCVNGFHSTCAGGRVDILVNNAGIIRDSSFAKMTKEQWDAVYRVHLEGTMKCVSHCQGENLIRLG